MDKTTSGILVLDKPAGMSSATAVARVKRLTKTAKVGHTGTLDPFATGALVCCLNKATRLADFMLKGQKAYEAVLCLGIATDTQDATGRVTAQKEVIPAFSEDELLAVFERYRGKSWQQPPAYSALKQNGVPLYKLARAGKPVHKPPREIEITKIAITEVALPHVRFTVSCSAGTYIRTLCADIGRDLGCGGHLKALRRTASGGFFLAQAVTLEALAAAAADGTWPALVKDMSHALSGVPLAVVDRQVEARIKNGSRLARKDMGLDETGSAGLVGVTNGRQELIAVLRDEKASPYFSYCCVLI